MRPFGSIIDKAVKLRDPPIPDARMVRVNPPSVSRLDEGLKELFDCACVANDLEAAADLLALMEKWYARRMYHDESQKRAHGILLKRMTGELHRRHIIKGLRPPATHRTSV